MKAYSVDLREKIVAAVGRGMSKARAARTFGVGATSLKRYVKLAEEGKPLSAGKAPAKKAKSSMETQCEAAGGGSALSPSRCLREEGGSTPPAALGVRVSKATIYRTVSGALATLEKRSV